MQAANGAGEEFYFQEAADFNLEINYERIVMQNYIKIVEFLKEREESKT
jgi:hypothetical protein